MKMSVYKPFLCAYPSLPRVNASKWRMKPQKMHGKKLKRRKRLPKDPELTNNLLLWAITSEWT